MAKHWLCLRVRALAGRSIPPPHFPGRAAREGVALAVRHTLPAFPRPFQRRHEFSNSSTGSRLEEAGSSWTARCGAVGFGIAASREVSVILRLFARKWLRHN